MDKLFAGVVLGFAAAIWVAVYTWVGNTHIQALMVFVGIVSAVRAVSVSRVEGTEEVYRG